MMELSVLDTNLIKVAVLDTFESLIWTDRYSAFGDFEIYNSIGNQISAFLKEDYYLVSKDSEHVMIIEDNQVQSDAENGSYYKITGRSLESILDRRIVWQLTTLGGNLQNGIKKLLDENVISPSDPDRKISNFVFVESTDPRITELTIDTQFTGDNLYNAIKAICDVYNLGFKVTLEDTSFVFRLYMGDDRSYSQTANPYVVFSPKFENLTNSNYAYSKKTLKTITLVGGEGEGTDRRTISVSSSTDTGLNRREMFTDARDISSSAPGDNLCDKSRIVAGFIDLTTGEVIQSPDHPDSKYGDSIPVTAGTNYYLSGYAGDMRYRLYNPDGSYNGSASFTSPGVWIASITGFIVPLFYTGITDEQLATVMINVGTDALPYIAFNKLTDAEYNAQLQQRGSEDLSNNTITQAFDGQAEIHQAFKYGEDFFMGDIVQIANEYGMEARSRIAEVVFSQSTSSIDVVPTFTAVN